MYSPLSLQLLSGSSDKVSTVSTAQGFRTGKIDTHGPAMEAMKAVSDYGNDNLTEISSELSSIFLFIISSLFSELISNSISNLISNLISGDHQLVVSGIFENYLKIRYSDSSLNKVSQCSKIKINSLIFYFTYSDIFFSPTLTSS